MSISQFSFDIKPDIFYNVQVRRLCWPGKRFQIVFSLVFFKHPGSMDWGIIIMEKILFSGKCLAITSQMLSFKIDLVLYFSELIFQVLHVNVQTPYQQIHPMSLLDIFCPVLMEPSQVYILHRAYGKYTCCLYLEQFVFHPKISLYSNFHPQPIFSSLSTKATVSPIFSLDHYFFFFKTLFWNPCWLK